MSCESSVPDETTPTAQTFEQQAIKYGLKEWKVCRCDICGVETGFTFLLVPYKSYGFVMSEDGCMKCLKKIILKGSSWEDVANHYKANSRYSVRKEYDRFWHFDTNKIN